MSDTKQPISLTDLNALDLTAAQAFRAMQRFLLAYFERVHGSERFHLVLGDIEVNDDGFSSDPASLSDWKRAVQAVLAEDA